MTATINPGTDIPRRPTPGPVTRFVDVRANLMPPEVLGARQTDKLRRRVLIGLAAAAAVAVAGYGASWLQTESAHSNLSDLRHRTTALDQQQQKYAPLAQAQQQVAASKTQLGTLMASDVDWNALLGSLHHKATKDIVFTNIGSTINSTFGTAPQSTTDPLNLTGKTAVGTLTITGTASSKNSVAAFSDGVARIRGVAAVLVTSVTAGDATGNAAPTSGVVFTLTATLTSDALGGRFTVSATTPAATSTTGGK